MGAANSVEGRPEGYENVNDGGSGQVLPSALVICGPSGVGKGTLINQLVAQSRSYGFSCSHTTRQPRHGEKVHDIFFLLLPTMSQHVDY